MKALQIVEEHVYYKDETYGIWCEEWREIARFLHDLPDEFYSFYNEAYFCPCCGTVRYRRRWADRQCSWWINIHKHNIPPFSFYDFPTCLNTLNPEVEERLVNEFLNDPTICGYTSAAGFTNLEGG